MTRTVNGTGHRKEARSSGKYYLSRNVCLRLQATLANDFTLGLRTGV